MSDCREGERGRVLGKWRDTVGRDDDAGAGVKLGRGDVEVVAVGEMLAHESAGESQGHNGTRQDAPE